MLVTWISTRPFAHKVGSSLARVGSGRGEFEDDDSEGDMKKSLHYSPWNGSFSFWYKNRLLTFRRMQKDSNRSFFPKEEISVSCIGRSPKILRELFSECRMEYLKLIQNKTSIFEHGDCGWEKTDTIDIRPLDTVIIDEKKKTELLKDIKDFLDPQTRAWYSQRGIPYRKGYLLYGPPGTGKSSLSLSIAGSCGLDIYTLNLSTLNDNSLRRLFTKLPEQCVILIEDIDAVHATHSRQHEPVKADQHEIGSFTGKNSRGGVSLSSLLNVLDGVGSQEGRVLIMSTNHVEHLDGALIRSGRVDMQIELGLTNRDINTRLFRHIFMHDNPSPGGKLTDEAVLRKLAGEFANKVPEQEFSPADIQLFLRKYRQSPHMAVENVEEWVMKTKDGKRQIKSPDSGQLYCGVVPPPDKPERRFTLPAASSSSPTYDFLTLSQPATKSVAHPELKIAEAHYPGDTVSNLPNNWDFVEPLDLSYNAHSSSDRSFSDDDSSSETSFDSMVEPTATPPPSLITIIDASKNAVTCCRGTPGTYSHECCSDVSSGTYFDLRSEISSEIKVAAESKVKFTQGSNFLHHLPLATNRQDIHCYSCQLPTSLPAEFAPQQHLDALKPASPHVIAESPQPIESLDSAETSRDGEHVAYGDTQQDVKARSSILEFKTVDEM